MVSVSSPAIIYSSGCSFNMADETDEQANLRGDLHRPVLSFIASKSRIANALAVLALYIGY